MILMPPHSFTIPTLSLVFFTLLHVSTLPIATAATITSGGNETDRLALLGFKSKIIHDPLGIMSSWNESLHFCRWRGVTCSRRHARVTILDLASRGLVGSLSPCVGNLSFLRELMLYNNTLQGEIPPQLGHLFRLQILKLNNNSFEGESPANLSNCSNLTHFGVGYNKLVGKFPNELYSLSKLINLFIHVNYLTGGIPPSFGNLTSLKIISGARNLFRGTLPDSLGQLKNLTELSFGGNELSGMIPSSIYNLSLLTVLSLARNQLRGSLPRGIGLMFPHLQYIQFGFNQLTGPLPPSISNCSELERLDMAFNNFNGKLAINFGGLQKLWILTLQENSFGSGEPDEMDFIGSLANCSNLETLVLTLNQLRGAMPNSVGNLSSQLSTLLFGGNLIHGNLPSAINNLLNLSWLSVGRNRFTGTIPTNIGYLQNLKKLNLADNEFSGEIPGSIGNLSLMIKLRMSNNRLEGNIPSSLGNCKKLLLLELHQNKLSGMIPKQLFRISSLSMSLNLAQNHLFGSLHSEVGNLKNLAQLVISENKLSGELPSSLGRCTSLENLYLEGNYFNGSIPQSLSSLRGIQYFDLSRNNLSGQILRFLEHFSLKYLNLSFNDFEGEVPTKGVFTNVSAISIVENDRLCGGIPELQLPKCSIKEPKKQKMSRALILAISIVCAFLGVITVLSFLFCWLKKKRKTQPSESLLKESFLKVSYEELLKATDGFSSSNLIGAGSYGSVYKGTLDQEETTVVAVKVLNLQHQGASKGFMAECEALRNVRHRNLVKVITSCSSVDFQGNNFKALVYEFMPNGSLERWLHSSSETDNMQNEIHSLNLLQRINIAIDVAFAVEYLHHHSHTPIIHCDLKPSNILLDSEMVAHVGDFGLAKFLLQVNNRNQSSSIGLRGTVGYAAPEYGLGSEVSRKGDVYGYGILILEMMTGRKPIDSMFMEGLNLHRFVRTALPDQHDHVMEITDPTLLKIDEESAASMPGLSWVPRESINGNRMECIISMIKIGVECSMESPQDRMDITDVVRELNSVRNTFLGTQNRS